MPTELLTRASLPANSADSGYFMPGIKSAQKPTIRHDDFSFGDLLSLFNPLNLIPGVSTLHAAATGEKASPVSSLIGGAIFGGPIGMAIAGIGAVFEEATGKGVIGSIADAVKPGDQPRDYTAYYSKIANAHKPDYKLFTSA